MKLWFFPLVSSPSTKIRTTYFVDHPEENLPRAQHFKGSRPIPCLAENKKILCSVLRYILTTLRTHDPWREAKDKSSIFFARACGNPKPEILSRFRGKRNESSVQSTLDFPPKHVPKCISGHSPFAALKRQSPAGKGGGSPPPPNCIIYKGGYATYISPLCGGAIYTGGKRRWKVILLVVFRRRIQQHEKTI